MDLNQFFLKTGVTDEEKCIIICKIRSKIIKDISADLNWHNSDYKLMLRLQKTYNNQRFSVRDLKILSRELKQQKKSGKFQIQTLSWFFPGKTELNIRKAAKKVLNVEELPF